VKKKQRRKSDLLATIIVAGLVLLCVLNASPLRTQWGNWGIVFNAVLLVLGIVWRVLETVEDKKTRE
jgi:hypothetical protein